MVYSIMGDDGENVVSDTPTTCDFWVFSSGEQEIVAPLSTSESTSLLSNVIVDIIIEAEKSISITESKTAEQLIKGGVKYCFRI